MPPIAARPVPPSVWQHGGVDEAALRALLDDVTAGRVEPDDVVARLRRLPFADLGDALVDHHRHLRQGMPEAVYGPGKSPEQCARIVGELLANGSGAVLLTRAADDQIKAVEAAHGPATVRGTTLLYRQPPATRAVERPRRDRRNRRWSGRRRVHPDTAAPTASIPIASTTSASPACTGCWPTSTASRPPTRSSCWPGMEGALASVIGGLTAAPVIAVPTSVGYGTSLDGVTALLAMHASCASGVTVVGIDNGFGAACAVARMFH